MTNVFSFEIGEMSWSTERFYNKDIHVKCQRSRTHCSKVSRKVDVFKNQIELQGHGYMVKMFVPTEKFR